MAQLTQLQRDIIHRRPTGLKFIDIIDRMNAPELDRFRRDADMIEALDRLYGRFLRGTKVNHPDDLHEEFARVRAGEARCRRRSGSR